MELIILLTLLIGIRFLIGFSLSLSSGGFKVNFVMSILILLTWLKMIQLKITFNSTVLDVAAGLFIIAAISFIFWNSPRLFFNIDNLTYRRHFLITKFLNLLSIISGPTIFILAFFILAIKPDKEITLNDNLTYKERKYRRPLFVSGLTIEITSKIDVYGIFEKHILRKDYNITDIGYREIEMTYKNNTIYLKALPEERLNYKGEFIDSINIKNTNW